MIDLRSDTITRPTEAMLESMREASYGDESRDGDETVMKLEALASERTGKEAGAFMPSGTMTNLVAVLAHAQRGGTADLAGLSDWLAQIPMGPLSKRSGSPDRELAALVARSM